MFDVGADERCETKGERCCQQSTTPHRDRPSICARNGWIFDTLERARECRGERDGERETFFAASAYFSIRDSRNAKLMGKCRLRPTKSASRPQISNESRPSPLKTLIVLIAIDQVIFGPANGSIDEIRKGQVTHFAPL